MLTVLIIRGATLSGAIEGVKFYMGTVNLSALKSPNVSQIDAFYCEDISHGIVTGLERSLYSSILCFELLQWRPHSYGIIQRFQQQHLSVDHDEPSEL